jgi:hypothetical protein
MEPIQSHDPLTQHIEQGVAAFYVDQLVDDNVLQRPRGTLGIKGGGQGNGGATPPEQDRGLQEGGYA